MDPNDVGLTDTTGFNVINGVSIFPHYTNKKSKLTEEQNEARHNKFTEAIVDFSRSVGPVIAYPEEDTLYIDGDNIEMLGERDYYHMHNGIVSQYKPVDNNGIKNFKTK